MELDVELTPVNWKRLLLKIAFWLLVETILSLYGLDNLADYSEYVFERRGAEAIAALQAATPNEPLPREVQTFNIAQPQVAIDP